MHEDLVFPDLPDQDIAGYLWSPNDDLLVARVATAHRHPKTKICDTPRARKNNAQPPPLAMLYCPGTPICRMHPIQ
jgi:hypothetical protein